MFTTFEEVYTYFRKIKKWGIPLDWAFNFYLPDSCEYDVLKNYGIKKYEDFKDKKKYDTFLNTYVLNNLEEIMENLRDTYKFTEDKIIRGDTYIDDEGKQQKLYMLELGTDRLDRAESNSLYFIDMGLFGYPPDEGETFDEFQRRLRITNEHHKKYTYVGVSEVVEY